MKGQGGRLPYPRERDIPEKGTALGASQTSPEAPARAQGAGLHQVQGAPRAPSPPTPPYRPSSDSTSKKSLKASLLEPSIQ